MDKIEELYILQNIINKQNAMLDEKMMIIKVQNRKIATLSEHIRKLLKEIKILQMIAGN